MNASLKILIVDKNKRVGDFIKRELEKDHHQVFYAENAEILKQKIGESICFDLLIIDPDLPDSDVDELFVFISEKMPGIPVVFHAYNGDFNFDYYLTNVLAHIEKKGNSIDKIRKVVLQRAQLADLGCTVKKTITTI